MEQLSYKGFKGTVEFSREDGCLFGRVAGIDDLVSYEGKTVADLRQSFEEAVEHYMAVSPLASRPERGTPAPGSGAG